MSDSCGDALRATHEPSRKRLGLTVGIAIAAMGLMGCERHIVRDAIAASEQHQRDVFLCRLLIGVEDPFKGSYKRLEMACAHDVVAVGVRKGLKRTAAADIAASQCLPDLTPCNRALASGTGAGTAETGTGPGRSPQARPEGDAQPHPYPKGNNDGR